MHITVFQLTPDGLRRLRRRTVLIMALVMVPVFAVLGGFLTLMSHGTLSFATFLPLGILVTFIVFMVSIQMQKTGQYTVELEPEMLTISFGQNQRLSVERGTVTAIIEHANNLVLHSTSQVPVSILRELDNYALLRSQLAEWRPIETPATQPRPARRAWFTSGMIEGVVLLMMLILGITTTVPERFSTAFNTLFFAVFLALLWRGHQSPLTSAKQKLQLRILMGLMALALAVTLFFSLV